MQYQDRENMISNYIGAYNQFDIDGMTADLADNLVFENVQDGKVTMSLTGLDAFREQAEQAKAYFSERKQEIRSIRHSTDSTEVEIGYRAVLAIDFPNGLKKGQELNLSGRSVFAFRDGKIVKLTDLS
ncbi:nuclear transport factor 2 family protein [Arcticibacter sp. MXS-1]|uniref:nuclear transport factor 2 family protein n=1 Tax=Arcticibacter sp. MXS-1 TaxID=3341726 RepID=UPI0035A8F37A